MLACMNTFSYLCSTETIKQASLYFCLTSYKHEQCFYMDVYNLIT